MKRIKKQSVLIVDDDPLNLAVLTEVVSQLPLNVYTASNGRTGLRMAEDHKPDAILMDIGMPDINGIEVCRRIKQNPGLQNIPIVFVTALTDVTNQADASAAGGSGFLTKPIRKALVFSTIDQVLRVKGLTDQITDYSTYFDKISQIHEHELSQLLGELHSCVNLLAVNSGSAESVKVSVSLIQRKIVELQSLAKLLVEVSKLLHNTYPFEYEETDLYALVAEATSSQAKNVQAANLYLNISTPPQVFNLLIDPALTRVILKELIQFCLKYCDRSGLIDVRLIEDRGKTHLLIEYEGKALSQEEYQGLLYCFTTPESACTLEKARMTFCRLALEEMGGSLSLSSKNEDQSQANKQSFDLAFRTRS